MLQKIKRFGRFLLRAPRTGYRYTRAAATFPRRYRAQNDRIGRLEESQSANQINALTAHIPVMLGYITSFSHTSRQLVRNYNELQKSADEANETIGSVAKEVQNLWERVEFVRRETLFELLYTDGKTGVPQPKPESRILNEEKLAAMGNDVRVNVGCGHIPVEGYLNVDKRELPGIDVVADATDMPFSQNSLSELFSSHVIEHFPQEEFARVVLPYWVGLLRPDGVLRAILPDWEAMITTYAQGSYAFEDLREVTFGAQDYDGDFHFNMFSQASLRQVLEAAGLKDVTYPVTGRKNGKCLEMEVRAVK